MLDPLAIEHRIRLVLQFNWDPWFRDKPIDQASVTKMLAIATNAVVEEFNAKFQAMLDSADTQLLERAAVLLAQRVQERGDL